VNQEKMKLVPFKIESVQATPANSVPYGVRLCQAPAIWDTGEGGEGVVIAVLDTGIDTEHPDLTENIVGGRNFTENGLGCDNFQDDNGHGTHVAGIIAASGGIYGVAPAASLLVLKVLDADGASTYNSVIDGIRYAVNWRGENEERVRIINMSLGGPDDDPELRAAILEACAAGILVVVASGNEGDADESTYEYSYPALYRECVTVAACDENKEIASFTNNHVEVDVIAAGVNVLSTYLRQSYARLSGTSMATPHVSGILALLINLGERKFKRQLLESEIFALLARCCCSLGAQASTEGHGMPELSAFFEKC
jgi:major intracellular serine protease